MKSIRRIALCVAFIICTGTLSVFAWQDYQLRHDEFYKLGALYKARFPKVGKYVVDELKKGDDESLMALGFMLVPDDATAQEKAFIESAGELLMDSDIHGERKKAAAFVAGFESTPSVRL
jgi:hypothetical protein